MTPFSASRLPVECTELYNERFSVVFFPLMLADGCDAMSAMV